METDELLYLSGIRRQLHQKRPSSFLYALTTATPRNITHNCISIVSLDRLPHQEDVKCDNLGFWRNNGTKNHMYEMNEDRYPELLDEEEAREATDTYSQKSVLQE